MTVKEFWKLLKRNGCKDYTVAISGFRDEDGVTIAGDGVAGIEVHKDTKHVFPRYDKPSASSPYLEFLEVDDV